MYHGFTLSSRRVVQESCHRVGSNITASICEDKCVKVWVSKAFHSILSHFIFIQVGALPHGYLMLGISCWVSLLNAKTFKLAHSLLDVFPFCEQVTRAFRRRAFASLRQAVQPRPARSLVHWVELAPRHSQSPPSLCQSLRSERSQHRMRRIV